MKKTGICYLVGAGPGDPGLLTLRGRECLSKAEVVVYDYLSNPEFLKFAPEDAEKIYAGKQARAHTLTQEEIDALLVQKTSEGRVVVRLKGGDPYLFGRGGEEAAALSAAGLNFEVVPGISSSLAGPAFAGIPVTHREHNAVLTIFTGHEDPTKQASTVDYAALAKASGTKVLLMGVERIEAITSRLMENGMCGKTPVALVRWATTGRQETLVSTLENTATDVALKKFRAPAVIVFGDVVNLRDSLNWFEKRPLFGRRIAVTRTRSQGSEMIAQLRELGADAFELPTIRIAPPVERRAFYELVADVHTYDWLVFTSPNGVESFFEVFYEIFKDARSLGGVRIAAVGPATAEKVKTYRFAVDLMPERFLAGEICDALEKETSLDNLKVLLACGEMAKPELEMKLTKAGAIVDRAVCYRTIPEKPESCAGIERFRSEGADLVTFTSASTAENFHALSLPWPEGCRTASIGPVTSAALQKLGYSVDLEASEHNIPGLIAEILAVLGKK